MINLQDRLANLSPQKRALIEKKLSKMEAAAFSDRSIPRRTGGGPVPLSFAQQRLWFLDQFEPGSSLYNRPIALRLEGALNVVALRQSLQDLIGRHEPLRTTFATIDGEAMQVIHEPSPFELDTIDLSQLSEENRSHEARRLQHEEAQHPFDLANGPLFRGSLLRISDDLHVLLLTMHHIVSDGWSQRILRSELHLLYNAYCLGEPSPLPDLPLQYADYAVWQRDWLQGETLDLQVSYWKNRLLGAPALLELPYDWPRPAVQSFRGARKSISIPSALTHRIKALGQREGTTLFMTVLAAFEVLLSRYSGQDDIVVGTPIANRTESQTEGLIGFFSNTLALRTDLSDDPRFVELLHRVCEECLGAYAHQALPFEKIVEELQPDRSLSYSPIFQVMFILQNDASDSLILEGLRIEGVRDHSVSAKFDLTLALSESNGQLRGALEYNTDLFGEDRIERMMGQFRTLLEGIAANPDERISRLPVLTQSERDQLLVVWNDTSSGYPKAHCLHQLFEEQVRRTPDAVALVFEGEELTYSQLNARANQLARFLRQQGVVPNTLVGVCMARSIDMVVALLAILKAGGAYVAVDPTYPVDRIRYTLQDASASLILTQEALLAQLPVTDVRTVCPDRDAGLIGGQASDDLPCNAQPTDLAYVLYTSGSTGRPKGVAIEHHSPVALVSWALGQLTEQELSGVVFATSICFDLSVYELFVTLCGGGRVLLVENALAIAQMPAVLAPTLINTVPSAMAELLRQGGAPASLLRVNLAGEPLTASLVDAIYDQTTVHKVYDLYGPSEDTTYSTCALRQRAGRVTIGRPIANTRLYVLDRDLHPVPVGVSGELYIGGDGLARGYLNRADLTAERFVPDQFTPKAGARLYRTGDLVKYLPDGNIEYLRRLDHQVKIRGFRIELGEIESALLSHAGVRDAVVLAREDVPDDRRLVAYVSSADSPASASLLEEYLLDKLPGYMVPSAFVFLHALPLTSNGKVDRKALPVPKVGSEESESGYAAPSTAIEEGLAEIWRELLQVETVGIRDSFFELGGHSLLAVRLISEIRRVFGQKLPLQMLFQSATIASIARELSPEFKTTCWANVNIVTPVKSGSDRVPMFCMASAQANALGYVALGRRLGEDQPLFVLQSHYRSNNDRPYTPEELHDLAAVHIRTMRDRLPDGPYCLGGMCEGAHIAFEMARQLQLERAEVPLLVSFDAWPEENTRSHFGWWLNAVSLAFERLRKGKIGTFGVFAQIARVTVRSIRQWYAVMFKSLDANSWEARYWPGRSFVPPKFNGKMVVFRVAKQKLYRPKQQDLGWTEWTTHGVEIYDVSGDHLTLLREPNVQKVAAILAEHLNRVEQTVLPLVGDTLDPTVLKEARSDEPIPELYAIV